VAEFSNKEDAQLMLVTLGTRTYDGTYRKAGFGGRLDDLYALQKTVESLREKLTQKQTA
jgi:hypothetical protein